MQLEFKNIDLKDVRSFMDHWELTAQRSSDYSFPILWSWACDYGYQAAADHSTGLYWIRQTKPDLYNLAPIGRWEREDWKELLTERYGDKSEFWLVPEKLLAIWQKQFGDNIWSETDRGNWEYLYSIRELADLKGKKYVKKRNRINQFCRLYQYEYKPITQENAETVAEFQQAWVEENAKAGYLPGIQQENHGIQRILRHWGHIPNLRGGIIEVDGKIAAYTIGELAVDDIFVHFEKAGDEFNTGYQVINKEFLSHMADEHPELVTANREEDVGDPGLREAKMSYVPMGFVKKYHVKVSF